MNIKNLSKQEGEPVINLDRPIRTREDFKSFVEDQQIKVSSKFASSLLFFFGYIVITMALASVITTPHIVGAVALVGAVGLFTAFRMSIPMGLAFIVFAGLAASQVYCIIPALSTPQMPLVLSELVFMLIGMKVWFTGFYLPAHIVDALEEVVSEEMMQVITAHSEDNSVLKSYLESIDRDLTVYEYRLFMG